MGPNPPIALFGYDSSPFTQKIRLALRFLQVPYTFVLVPSMMPRPILLDNFNLAYRKIPVLAIGKDLIVDTSLILEYLYSHPSLRANQEQIHQNPRDRTLARLLSSHYTDRPLFRLTTGLIPSVVWRTSFGTDRAKLIGHTLDANKLEKKVPRNLVALDTYLSILEPLFQDGGWVLGGDKPSAADISLYYQLDWGEKISRGEGIEDLTGGGTQDGTGKGMSLVFNKQRYPGLLAWFGRFEAHVSSLPSMETRIERDDEQGVQTLMSKIRDSQPLDQVLAMPTPNSRLEALEHGIGLKIGTQVSIAPDDTGRGDPTMGRLIALSPEEAVITPERSGARQEQHVKSGIKDMRIHFPRVGFVLGPITAVAKL